VQQDTIIVVAGGDPPSSGAPRQATAIVADSSTTVIAADSGIDRAIALGLHVDLAVGDFDSVTPGGLAAAEAGGARVERHPAAKDATDLELALDAALALCPRRVLVVGAPDGRLDHLLASLLLLGSERYAGVELDAQLGGAQAHLIRSSRTLTGAVGELVSLLPVGGAAEGVTTTGLAYPLAGETLDAGTSRGVSNVFAEQVARIDVERGVLLAVRPGTSS
jgi:thiamine pyrophosphokinase